MILIYFGGFRTLAVPLRTLRATHSLVFLGGLWGLRTSRAAPNFAGNARPPSFSIMEAWADPRKQKKKQVNGHGSEEHERSPKILSLLGVHFDSSNIDDDTSSASVS